MIKKIVGGLFLMAIALVGLGWIPTNAAEVDDYFQPEVEEAIYDIGSYSRFDYFAGSGYATANLEVTNGKRYAQLSIYGHSSTGSLIVNPHFAEERTLDASSDSYSEKCISANFNLSSAASFEFHGYVYSGTRPYGTPVDSYPSY